MIGQKEKQMSLGEIIRKRRKELGMTQDQVVDQIGISKPYLSHIETGKTKNPPTDGILKDLERVLHFVPGELLTMGHLGRTPLDIRHKHQLLEEEVQKLRNALTGLLAGSGGKNAEQSLQAREGVDIDDLLGGEHANIKTISAGSAVPIINKVAAGYPTHFTDLDYPRGVADEYIRCPDVHDAQAFATRISGDSMEPMYHEGDLVIFSPNTPARSGDDCFVRFESDGSTTFKRFYLDLPDTIRLQPLNNQYPAQTYHREMVSGLWPAVFRIERLRAGR